MTDFIVVFAGVAAAFLYGRWYERQNTPQIAGKAPRSDARMPRAYPRGSASPALLGEQETKWAMG
jgi:hypothetical protein